MTPSVPSPPLPAAVVFDWDGTIADSLGLIYRAERPIMRRHGIPMSRARFRETYSPDWRTRFSELGIPEEAWADASRTWAEGMLRLRPRAFPWVRRALARLRAEGVRTGLVTASDRSIVERGMTMLNMQGAFDHIVCAEDVTNQKPHPEGLLTTLDALGVAADEAVYLGDTLVDLAMARAAGVAFVPIGGTIDDEVFLREDARPVWPSVVAWTDALLDGHER